MKYVLTILTILSIFCVKSTNYEELQIPDTLPKTTLNISYENYLEISKSNYLTNWFSTELSTDTSSYEAKIRIQGGISKHSLKKSYKLVVYKGYPADIKSTHIISAQFGDPTLCKSRLGMHLFEKAGFLCPKIKATHLFFDGWFQGVYLEIEPLDEYFFINRNMPITSFYFSHPHAYFSLQNGYTPENVFEKKLPKDSNSYKDLHKLFIAIDKGITAEDTTELASILDIKNALDYYTIAVLIRHSDGITNNLGLFFNFEIQKFQFIPWDLTSSFSGAPSLTNPAPPGYVNNLFDQMIKIDNWNRYCQKRIKKLFDEKELLNLVDEYSSEVRSSLGIDPTYPQTEWEYNNNVNQLKKFIKSWTPILQKDSIYFATP